MNLSVRKEFCDIHIQYPRYPLEILSFNGIFAKATK